MDFSELEKRLASMSIHIPSSQSLLTTGRQMGKSLAYAKNYGGAVSPEPSYTQDQHDAFAAAIAGLSDQHPVVGRNRKSRKQLKARATAEHFAKMGSPENATAQAIYGGIPKDALAAIRTLIFD